MVKCKVLLTFESVDEILWCDHSDEATEQYFPVVLFFYAVQGGSNFWAYGRKSCSVTIQMKATE